MILKNGKRIDGLGDNMPIGSVIEYNGTDIPDGWEVLPGDANVYIGSIKPTEGQEVWIQKGKNLFDKNKVVRGEAYGVDGVRVENINWSRSYFIKVQPNTVYSYSSQLISGKNEIQTTLAYWNSDKVWVGETYTTNLIETITTPEDCEYIMVQYRNDTLENIQLELGDKITDYEPYIDKKIHTKNDNGVYEEFNASKWGDLTEDILTENTSASWLAVIGDKGNMQHRTIENIIGSFGLLKGIKIDHYGNDLLQMPNNTVGSYYNDYTQNIPDINVFAGWGLAIMLGVNDYKALIVFGNYEYGGHNIAIKSFVPGNPGSWTDWRYI